MTRERDDDDETKKTKRTNEGRTKKTRA